VRWSTLGFLVAPLWAPVVNESHLLIEGGYSVSMHIVDIVGVSVIAYTLTFMIGFPLLRWLKRRARFWILAAAGLAAGPLICLVLLILFWAPVYFRYGMTFGVVRPTLGAWIFPLVLLTGMGFLIACTFWLIAGRDYLPEDSAQYF
jgi:hypothetical protein